MGTKWIQLPHLINFNHVSKLIRMKSETDIIITYKNIESTKNARVTMENKVSRLWLAVLGYARLYCIVGQAADLTT